MGEDNIYTFLDKINLVSPRESKQSISLAGYLNNTGQLGQKRPLNSHKKKDNTCAVLGHHSEAAVPNFHTKWLSLLAFLRHNFCIA